MRFCDVSCISQSSSEDSHTISPQSKSYPPVYAEKDCTIPSDTSLKLSSSSDIISSFSSTKPLTNSSFGVFLGSGFTSLLSPLLLSLYKIWKKDISEWVGHVDVAQSWSKRYQKLPVSIWNFNIPCFRHHGVKTYLVRILLKHGFEMRPNSNLCFHVSFSILLIMFINKERKVWGGECSYVELPPKAVGKVSPISFLPEDYYVKP